MDLNEEYKIVKIMLEKYTPYTHGIERALDLLEIQRKEIERLGKEKEEYRLEVCRLYDKYCR